MKVICFDALGTLIDISHVIEELDQKFPNRAVEISNIWRIKQLDYSRIRSMAGQYKPFDLITRDALIATLAQVGVGAETHVIDAIMKDYLHGVAFDDAKTFLHTTTTPWSIVTNANREMIRPMLDNAAITIADSDLLTSDQVRSFKVTSDLYELGWRWAQNKGIESKSDVLFVSANQWDAIAATWFGFTTCWVNRHHQPPESLDARPTYEISEFNSIADLLSSQP